MNPAAAAAAGPIVLDRYAEIREALFNTDLSRTFDRRSWADGNIRDGVVSIQHGAVHRARRRVENTQFRPDRLRLYERELFPGVLDRWVDEVVGEDGRVDLFALGELLSVVLASRRAGIDHDESREQLEQLVGYVDVFSQGAAILDAKDPEAVRTLYRATMTEFGERYVAPSRTTREAAVARYRAGEIGEDELPHDILTVLLLHREDAALELDDDGRLVREVATYLQGGTHTSSQVLVNMVDLLLPYAEAHPDAWARVASDRAFAQRCMHETLRLRPTTPKMKRHAEADTVVAGRAIPAGGTVVLDAAAANRDPALFGERPDAFDPDRAVDPSVARWGLSFGAGAHQCPGRSVAGGFPAPDPGEEADPEHVFGLSALMIGEVARRGIRPDPDRPPERDTRTERFTRWASYPVLLGPRPTG